MWTSANNFFALSLSLSEPSVHHTHADIQSDCDIPLLPASVFEFDRVKAMFLFPV
jgi:hypothetical protein